MGLEIKQIIVNGKPRKQYYFNGKKITKKLYNSLSQDYSPIDDLPFGYYLINDIIRKLCNDIRSTKSEYDAALILQNYLDEYENTYEEFDYFDDMDETIILVNSLREQADILLDTADGLECGDLQLTDFQFNDDDEYWEDY